MCRPSHATARRRASAGAIGSLLVLSTTVPVGCAAEAGQPALREISSPAGPGALGPNLARTSHGIFLSWLEPVVEVNEQPRHVLRVARLDADRGPAWSEPATVTSGDAFFANWADFPALAELPGGLVVHWLERLSEDDYAYGVRLARSLDGGKTWEPLGLLHDDRSPTEHGFVSFAPVAQGLQAFWLDGRAMASGGPMALRTLRLRGDAAELLEDAGPTPASTVLDERVCECCQTDAALATDGPVVVYRDRSDDEMRDIFIVRARGDGWSEPRRVAEDRWRIPGCPVNGPAVGALGNRVVVAWFTGANDRPAVKAATSLDGGASFGEPLLLDGESPIGRVDVAIAAGTAWVTWLTRAPEGAAVRLATLPLSPDASAPPPATTLASTGGARSSGFPRTTALDDDRLLVAWVDTAGEHPRVRTILVETGPAKR